MKNILGKVLLNRFRVDAFIESTRTSVVYRVWDLERNVPVAMKVLQADLADDPKIIQLFQREARALEKLAHPHIVPFFGLYQSGEMTFLVELFIDGPTLKSILRQRRGQPLPPEEALIYLKAVCAALGYAHRNGVVHCDIKPGNVMVDRGGNIFLTDFGVARHAESTTTTLGMAGTAAYMAPEQVRGEPVSAETDIYALGVMLYEMLTGQRPFAGVETGTDSSGQTAAERVRLAHLTTLPPNPLEITPYLPEGLASVIMIALSKDRNERYHSTDELLNAACEAIGWIPTQVPVRVSPPTILQAEGDAIDAQQLKPVETKKFPWVWVGAGVVAVILLCAVGLMGVSALTGRGLFPARQQGGSLTATFTAGPGDVGGQVARPTREATTTAVVLPTYTPQPTYTDLPTFTPHPTDTPAPLILPTATQPPAPTDLKIRIRNRTSGAVNFYRIGRSGERHFLGYILETGWYGEYPWPDYGPWTIEFCVRDATGNDGRCRYKDIYVESFLQEFSVP